MGEPGTGETLGEKSAMALHAEQAGAVLFGWGKSLREKMAAAASKVNRAISDNEHVEPYDLPEDEDAGPTEQSAEVEAMIAECRRELEHDGRGDENRKMQDEGVEGGWSGLGRRFSSSWSAGIGSLFRKGGVEGSGENVNCASRVSPTQASHSSSSSPTTTAACSSRAGCADASILGAAPAEPAQADVEAQELASVGTRIKRTVHMARVTVRAYSVLTLGATAVSQPADHSAVLASFTIALD